MIPQSYIDDVLRRVNIIEVIDARVRLKKTGKNYVACCPFHDEKSPSFTVTESKGLYWCFGCGAGGNAIGFLMQYERMDFKDAAIILGRSVGLDDPSRDAKPKYSIEARTGRYRQLRKQMRDDQLLIEIVKAARLRGEQIDPKEAPAIAEAIKRLKQTQEDIKAYADVERHLRMVGLEQQRRHEIMTVVCSELQENREQYSPLEWIPRRVPRIETERLAAAYSRINKIENMKGNL